MAKLKKLLTPRVTMVLFALAVILLLMSSMSGTRAALTYESSVYAAQVKMDHIGVTLKENGTDVSYRNYDEGSESMVSGGTGLLLENMLGDDEELKLGKEYPEVITVRNTGEIPQYVRVTLTKYWVTTDAAGNEVKNRKLDPSLIDLHALTDNGWTEAEDSRTEERSVYYYSGILIKDAETTPLTDTLTINYDAQATVTQKPEGNKIVTTYSYDDVKFVIEAQVDAVQDRHFDDAAVSAWGRTGPYDG